MEEYRIYGMFLGHTTPVTILFHARTQGQKNWRELAQRCTQKRECQFKFVTNGKLDVLLGMFGGFSIKYDLWQHSVTKGFFYYFHLKHAGFSFVTLFDHRLVLYFAHFIPGKVYCTSTNCKTMFVLPSCIPLNATFQPHIRTTTCFNCPEEFVPWSPCLT